MKKLILIILILISSICHSQDDNFYKAIGYSKVSLNKKLKSYSVFYTKELDGVEIDEKFPKPNLNNPHYIFIKSNKNSGRILIKNKKSKNIKIDFTTIYQGHHEDGITPYYFTPIDKNYEVVFFENIKDHNRLMIKIKGDSNLSYTLMYVISKL